MDIERLYKTREEIHAAIDLEIDRLVTILKVRVREDLSGEGTTRELEDGLWGDDAVADLVECLLGTGSNS